MQIIRITPEIHAELTALFNDNPELCFQNVGYQYLKSEVCEAKAPQIARITEILKEHVTGFVKFFNFRKDKKGIVLRFDYDWGAEDNGRHFIGVGYLPLDSMRDGFPEGASQC